MFGFTSDVMVNITHDDSNAIMLSRYTSDSIAILSKYLNFIRDEEGATLVGL